MMDEREFNETANQLVIPFWKRVCKYLGDRGWGNFPKDQPEESDSYTPREITVERKIVNLYQVRNKWTGKFMYKGKNYTIGTHDNRGDALSAAKAMCFALMGDESPYLKHEGNHFIS